MKEYEPMQFERAKTKELLAYLVNANGTVCSNIEIIVNLWDNDENHDPYFKKLRLDLFITLGKNGCEDILFRQRGGIGVATDRLGRDWYEWRKTNRGYFPGEYMKQWLWSCYWT